jgi:hypothetical protein
MRASIAVRLPPPGHRRAVATAGALLLSAVTMAACSSGTAPSASPSTSSSSTSGPTASITSPHVATGSPSGSTIASPAAGPSFSLSCPSASVVNTALGQTDIGPEKTGTAQYELCTYKGSTLSILVAISVSTPAEFDAAEQAVTSHGLKVVAVPGLGNQAWAAPSGGELAVLKSDTELEVTSPQSTAVQLENLARHIL